MILCSWEGNYRYDRASETTTVYLLPGEFVEINDTGDVESVCVCMSAVMPLM